MRKFALCLPLLLAWMTGPARAWGPEGHEIVAHVAAANLTPAARAGVARLLGMPAEAGMVLAANWADEVRDQRPATGAWHFVNIPLAAKTYDPARDCPAGNCVVAQLDREIGVIGDPRRPAAVRAEALRFLIHFAGDIHQPLHAADNGDRGGNDIHVRLAGARVSLHRIWDTNVVETMGYDAGKVARSIARDVTPAQRRAWQAGRPADWAMESAAVARRDVYGRLVRGHLPRGYLGSERTAARLQLAKAGVRLAWLINSRLK